AATRVTSGSGATNGATLRSDLRISSRSDTLPPLRPEALARHRRQVALARPGIGKVRREHAAELAEDPIGPGAREHPRRHAGDDALAQWDQPARGKLAPPGEELVVQVDPDRAHVAAGSAERGRERQPGVLLRIDV